MTIRQFFELLWARRLLMAAAFGLVMLVCAALTVWMPRAYTAEVSLVADGKGVDPVSGAAVPQQAFDSVIATQVDIIRSHNVALRVVDALKLSTDPKYYAEFLRAPIGTPLLDWLADRLVKHLDVVPSRESSVITIDFRDGDPATAAETANAFASAYMQAELDLKTDPARRQSDWYQAQVHDLRTSVETAQQRLSEFKRHSVWLASTNMTPGSMSKTPATPRSALSS